MRKGLWGLIAFFVLFAVVSVFVLFLLPFHELTDFLRLQGSLEKITSQRSAGLYEMIEYSRNSLLSGTGFGSADNNFPIKPSNILYAGLLVEVGLFGLLGFIGFLSVNLQIFWSYFGGHGSLKKPSSHVLGTFSIMVFAAFIPYLFFEFDVLRVSAGNQLFMFVWSFIFISDHRWSEYCKCRSTT